MARADCGKGSNSAQCFVKKNTIKTKYIARPVGGCFLDFHFEGFLCGNMREVRRHEYIGDIYEFKGWI